MITASAILKGLSKKNIRKPTARVYIMWDNFNWVDETERLKSVSGFEEMGGGLFEAGMSEIDVSFYNEDFHFTLGHPNCSLTEEQRVPRKRIKVEIGFNGHNITRFNGYIESYTPDAKSGEFKIHAFDRSYQMKGVQSGYVFFTNVSPTDLIRWLGIHAGLTEDDMILEESTNLIQFAYFEDRTVWFLMSQIAAAEGGRVFFDQDNKLNFWNRFHISFASEPVEELRHDDFVINQPYEISDKDIKNVIRVRAEARGVMEEQVVWNVGNEYKDEFRRIYAHNGDDENDLRFEVTLENPVTDFNTPLVAGVDYVANTQEDGGGTDVTSDIEFVEFWYHIKALVFRIRYNALSGIAYLTTLQVRGTPAKIYSRIEVEVSNDYSIGLYGTHVKDIENPYIDNYDFASAIAQTQLNMFANTISNFQTEIVALPYLQPGDVVAIQTIPEVDELSNYLITKLSWSWGPREGAKMTLTLAINYSEYNKISEDLVISGETHQFIIDDGSYNWGTDPDDTEWNQGSWL